MPAQYDERVAHLIKFSVAQDVRVRKCARYMNLTVQSFVVTASMKEVELVEKKILDEEAQKEREKQSKQARKANRPVGMGVREKLQAEAAQAAAVAQAAVPPPEPPPAPQVIINNGPAAQPSTVETEVERFALYVINGPQWSRPDRLREAVRILGVTARTPEERERLATALDDKIAALEGKPKSKDFLDMVKQTIFGASGDK